jgi:streptomycin 6-kinase
LGYNGRVTLDVPDELRRRVLADGNEGWLDELPLLAGSIARDWSLTLGASLRGGGVSSLVVEASLNDGTAAVLKIGVPGSGRELGYEATVLRLADGDPCARLLRADPDRGALLLERLGATMLDSVPDAVTRHDMLCDVAMRMWRPVASDVDLPTGAQWAREYATLLPLMWEETGRPCTWRSVEDAVACAERRVKAHDDRRAVLVHGDIHDANALQAPGGGFKLVDPNGLRAEPACDLGTIVRCNPDTGDDLRARTQRLAARTGVRSIASPPACSAGG